MEDKKTIYIAYIRSVLEQSCVVWHSSLTEENSNDLERIQKCAVRIMLGNNYTNYEDALIKADLQTLKERREELCLSFAKKCVKNDKTKHMFPENIKSHAMILRKEEEFEVNHANTERLFKSAIPYMQRIMNNEKEEKNNQYKQREPIRRPG